MPHPQKGLYGTQGEQEHRKEEVLRDVRSSSAQILAALTERPAFAITSILLSLLLVLEPISLPVIAPLLCLLLCLRNNARKDDVLPMRIPQSWPGKDASDCTPTGQARKARGMVYIGNERDKNKELWVARDDILTHTLVLGTTGAGKTETLVSLAFNYIAHGSGFLYIDPKAAPKLGVQIYTMARMLGRDDDFMLLSYMADKKVVQRHGAQPRTPLRQSNTMNPFATGSASQLTQLLFALMPEDKQGSSIFAANAMTLVSGLMFVLVEMRDKGECTLSISLIRRYIMNTTEIDTLARRNDLSEQSMLALRAGLATCSWDSSKDIDHQPRSFPEQYGYARAYFGRALSLLVDSYGSIFKTTHGEIDAIDVITSRRIYVTLIPSMDKDTKELKNLGQICLSSIRNACAVGLGEKIQGRIADVLGSLPTDARIPFGVVVDEYAAIETPGFELLLTQGRGLGIAVTVASQDFAGIKRASEAAAEQIVSNTKVKLFMCQEDPRQTYDLIKSLAGEAFVWQTTAKNTGIGNSTAWYTDNQARLEKTARVDFRDLQKQVEGQITAFFKGEMIRGKTFYAAPPLAPDQQVRLAYMLRLQQPDISELRARRGDRAALARALEALFSGARSAPTESQSELQELHYARRALQILTRFAHTTDYTRPELAITILIALCEFETEEEEPATSGSSFFEDEFFA